MAVVLVVVLEIVEIVEVVDVAACATFQWTVEVEGADEVDEWEEEEGEGADEGADCEIVVAPGRRAERMAEGRGKISERREQTREGRGRGVVVVVLDEGEWVEVAEGVLEVVADEVVEELGAGEDEEEVVSRKWDVDVVAG